MDGVMQHRNRPVHCCRNLGRARVIGLLKLCLKTALRVAIAIVIYFTGSESNEVPTKKIKYLLTFD